MNSSSGVVVCGCLCIAPFLFREVTVDGLGTARIYSLSTALVAMTINRQQRIYYRKSNKSFGSLNPISQLWVAYSTSNNYNNYITSVSSTLKLKFRRDKFVLFYLYGCPFGTII